MFGSFVTSMRSPSISNVLILKPNIGAVVGGPLTSFTVKMTGKKGFAASYVSICTFRVSTEPSRT